MDQLILQDILTENITITM